MATSTKPEETEEEREARWSLEIKYHAARTIWKVRHKKTPKGRDTWAKWFERKFGEDLLAYAKRMKKDN